MMLICDRFNHLKEAAGIDAASEYLINAQEDPNHVKELIRWARRFIECGHVVTAGYALIGPVQQKNKKTGVWEIIKDKGKIGTHSGYYKGWFKKHDRAYYEWLPNQIIHPWTMKDFSSAAIWLMMKEWEIMRNLKFEFNALFLHTNNMCIIDLDIYKSKIPKPTLDFILSKIPKGTPCSLSQAGGRHYYFKPTVNVVGKPKLGIDVLKNTGFVFAPPTKIQGGGSYAFENIHSPEDFPRDLPDMPPALRGFFGPPERVKQEVSIIHKDSFSTKQIEVLQKKLEEADKAIDRSTADFAAACWAVTIGMDVEKFSKYAIKYSKFADRGQEYIDRTWEKVLSII
jgi:hypothetical protein